MAERKVSTKKVTTKQTSRTRSTKATSTTTPKKASTTKRAAKKAPTPRTKSITTKTTRPKSTTKQTTNKKPVTRTRSKKLTTKASSTRSKTAKSTVVLPTRMSIRAREKALVLMEAFDADFHASAVRIAMVSGVCFLLVGATYSLYLLERASIGCGSACTAQVVLSTSGSTTVDKEKERSDNTQVQQSRNTFTQLGPLPSKLVDKTTIRATVTSVKRIAASLQYIDDTGEKTSIDLPVTDAGNDRYTITLNPDTLAPTGYVAKVFVLYEDGEETYYTLGKFTVSTTETATEEIILTNSEEASSSTDSISTHPTETESGVATTTKQPFEQLEVEPTKTQEPVVQVAGSLSGTGIVTIEHAESYDDVVVYARNLSTLISQPIDVPVFGSQVVFVTNQFPNGSYAIYVTATTDTGEVVRSQPVRTRIVNESIETRAQTEHLTEERSVFDVTAELSTTQDVPAVSKGEERLPEEVPPQSVNSDTISSSIASTALNEATTTTQTPATYRDAEAILAEKLKGDREKVQDLFNAYAAAKQTEDETLITAAQTSIAKYRQSVVESSVASESETIVADEINTMLEEQFANIESRVATFERIRRERTDADSAVDTDGDGISDIDEVALYRTDPTNPDSDADGFTDGAEIVSGFNPRDAAGEAVVTYESPKETFGLVARDKLEVATVVPDVVLATDSTPERTQAVVRGRALPNSFVTLFVFSTPTIVTVRTDADGVYEYTFTKELEDGEHQVFAAITDNTGAIVAQSEPFTFIKRARAFSPVDAANEDTVTIVSSTRSTDGYQVAIGMSILALGILLILLGLGLRTNEPELIPAA